jgi:lipopolysaccharide export system permease protein
MKILDLYIARMIVSTSGLCLLILTGLSGIIKWVDQLRLVGRGAYTMLDAGIYVLFLVPRDIEMFFPMAVLLGALIGMGMLASNWYVALTNHPICNENGCSVDDHGHGAR